MLPECRVIETFSIPKFDLVKEDVEGLIDELRGFRPGFMIALQEARAENTFSITQSDS